jgi:transcriptional regulator with XRE-family HTH domain
VPQRPSEVAASRIKALRKRHGWTQQQLADRLAELGSPLDRVAIAKIELGQRGLPLDEAFSFALALDVAPTNLFLPLEGEEVRVAGEVVIPSGLARRWVGGQEPLEGQDDRLYFSEVSREMWDAFQAHQRRQEFQMVEDYHRDQSLIRSEQRRGETLEETERRLLTEGKIK